MVLKIFLAFMLLSVNLLAQTTYYDQSTGEYFDIHVGTDPEIIEKYLTSIGAESIKFGDNTNWDGYTPYQVQYPDGKWQFFCQDYSNENQMINITPYDSIGFLTDVYNWGFTIVKDENKYGILDVTEYDRKKDNVAFDYEAIKVGNRDGFDLDYSDQLVGFYVKMNGKWGKMQMRGCCELTPVTKIIYNRIEDIPQNGFIPEKNFGKKHKIEWVEPINEFSWYDLNWKGDWYAFDWKVRGKNGKWGRIFLDSDEVYIIEPLIHNSSEDVPLVSFDEYIMKNIPDIRKKNNISRFQMVNYYVYKTEHAESGKIGLYSGEGYLDEKVPMLYDSINYYGQNPDITVTWLGGKLGYYLDSQLVKNNEFDDFKYWFTNSDWYIGLEKEGVWKMYNLETGELAFDESAISLEKLLYKWKNR